MADEPQGPGARDGSPPDAATPDGATHPATPDPATIEAAVAELAKALADVHDTIPRCASCWNFLATVARARRELATLAVPSADAPADDALPSLASALERFDAWLAEAEERVKTTNRCEVCVPAGPFERFLQALGRTS